VDECFSEEGCLVDMGKPEEAMRGSRVCLAAAYTTDVVVAMLWLGPSLQKPPLALG